MQRCGGKWAFQDSLEEFGADGKAHSVMLEGLEKQNFAGIQACWRGYVARKWYRHTRKTVSPKDKRLRRKFFEAKLQELNDSFVRYCHTDTEAFLSDIDRSLSSSRRVFQQLESKSVSEPQENDWDQIQSQSFCLTFSKPIPPCESKIQGLSPQAFESSPILCHMSVQQHGGRRCKFLHFVTPGHAA
ncbi:hypothetical protein F2P81_019098 [Scophthalmus maximus]|uniref:Uncharacterized protein n=1 Tax=Scophthalmus maximus TaxID=52904 RepID=A0A6A4SA88_SCOMX|nr:hypothetical protein F2P81_019098 [Scophthalmus maximus]